jgi:hypothetical protein
VQQTHGDDAEEDAHLDQRRPAELPHHGDPREEVDRVHREHDVEERVQVVPHLGLRPAGADRVDAALVRRQLLAGGDVGPQQPVDRHAGDEHQDPGQRDDTDDGVRLVPGHLRTLTARVCPGWCPPRGAGLVGGPRAGLL